MVKISRYDYVLGGLAAHVIRRLIHLSSILVVWVYYQYGAILAQFIGISLPQLVWLGLGIILVLETLRLSLGWQIFGQRHYEKNHLSAFAWSAIGMTLVLLFAPGKQFTVPIICAYAIGDPLLGELRRIKLAKVWVIIISVMVLSGIWWLAYIYLSTPLWSVFIMSIITVAAEWPCLTWIDDNALMLIVPLTVILIIHHIA